MQYVCPRCQAVYQLKSQFTVSKRICMNCGLPITAAAISRQQALPMGGGFIQFLAKCIVYAFLSLIGFILLLYVCFSRDPDSRLPATSKESSPPKAMTPTKEVTPPRIVASNEPDRPREMRVPEPDKPVPVIETETQIIEVQKPVLEVEGNWADIFDNSGRTNKPCPGSNQTVRVEVFKVSISRPPMDRKDAELLWKDAVTQLRITMRNDGRNSIDLKRLADTPVTLTQDDGKSQPQVNFNGRQPFFPAMQTYSLEPGSEQEDVLYFDEPSPTCKTLRLLIPGKLIGQTKDLVIEFTNPSSVKGPPTSRPREKETVPATKSAKEKPVPKVVESVTPKQVRSGILFIRLREPARRGTIPYLVVDGKKVADWLEDSRSLTAVIESGSRQIAVKVLDGVVEKLLMERTMEVAPDKRTEVDVPAGK